MKDLARLADAAEISLGEYVRGAVLEKLSRETGKDYSAIRWGGHRLPANREATPRRAAPNQKNTPLRPRKSGRAPRSPSPTSSR